MTVQELIDILQKLPKDGDVLVLDADGNETTYISVWQFDKRVELVGEPEVKNCTLRYEDFIPKEKTNEMA